MPKNHLADLPIYPLLIGVYAVLFLWSVNVGQVLPEVTLRAFLVSLGISGGVFLACLGLLRRRHNARHKAGLISALLLAILFMYGHFFALVDGLAIGRHRIFMPIMAALFLVGAGLVLRARGDLRGFTAPLNLVMLALIVMAAVPVIGYELRYGGRIYANRAKSAAASAPAPAAGLPDVYYIILDGYTRSDELAATFHYDNSDFTGALKKLGFYIPECAFSNYITTTPSLSSSMNMAYLETLGISEKATVDSFDPSLSPLMIQSKVRREFESLGYKVAAFRGYLPAQDLRDADYYFNYEEQEQHHNLLATHNFERMYMRTSILRPLVEAYEANETSVEFLPAFLRQAMDMRPDLYTVTDRQWYLQDQYTFDTLPKISALPGKKFVYAHFYATHQPYVFAQDGAYTPQDVHYNDSGYAPAVAYTSQRILAIVQELIARSAVPPVIIIQADHGMHSGIDHNKILNAYYFPGGDYSRLYATITPVNTFRVVLDQFFGRAYSLLPDTLLVKDDPRPGQGTARHIPASCGAQ